MEYDITANDLLQPAMEDYKVDEKLIAVLEPEAEEEKEEKEDRLEMNKHGKNIIVDESCLVSGGTDQIIAKVNQYSYSGDACGECCYRATCGVGYFTSRRTIQDGYFGHYVSSGRHKLTPPGIQHLTSCTDDWSNSIPIDDTEDRKNPRGKDKRNWGSILGSKYLAYVDENFIGGAYRLGIVEEKKDSDEKSPKSQSTDGQFVLFAKGRHILDSFKYKDFQITNKLRENNQDRIKIGPITVLYLSEGYLGGAYDVWSGKFEILYPGAPHLLHDQDYRNIVSVQTTVEPYKLGPYTFVTVLEGYLAGAYNKETGEYQVLPPGHTYWLQEKDWQFNEHKDLVEVSDNFVLGPYIYLTVNEGFISGSFHKKSGKFIELPEGSTYRLNIDDFEYPITVKADGHRIVCGPITHLTLQAGTLNGAFSLASGKFIEFDQEDEKYKLHEREYRDITTIQRNEEVEQQFGVYKVITIPDGSNGIFEREGVIEVKEPGFYKLTSEYRILPSISVNTFTMSVPELPFKTKDGIEMSVNASMVWVVNDPKLTSIITPDPDFRDYTNPAFETARRNMKLRLKNAMVKYVMKYNRDELLPTKQDVALKNQNLSGEELDEVLKQENKKTEELYQVIEAGLKMEMDEASEQSKWGICIDSVKLEGVELLDRNILNVLNQITETIFAINKEKVDGEQLLAEEEQKKLKNLKDTETDDSVRTKNAMADSSVKLAEAAAAAEEKKKRALANADDAINKAKTENAAKVSLATTREKANATAREKQLDIENRVKLSAAKADAESIRLLADANFKREVMENEAIEKMSDKQFKLKMMQKSILAMHNLSGAAWRMPDKVLDFYNQFDPMLGC